MNEQVQVCGIKADALRDICKMIKQGQKVNAISFLINCQNTVYAIIKMNELLEDLLNDDELFDEDDDEDFEMF